MTTIDTHAPGTCAWIELITSDAEAASELYMALFGWEVHRIPLGPGAWYNIYRIGGRDVAASFTMTPEMTARSVPPHWMTYFATPSADDSAVGAAAAGGRVLKPPFDVGDVGRMAALADPQGAEFAVWQPKSNPGIGRRDEPGALRWNELMTPDPEGAVRFYTGLFGLGHQSMPLPTMNYDLLLSSGMPSAGVLQITPEMGPVRPNWLPYFEVPDCDIAARRLLELGGRLSFEPTSVPAAGRFAVLVDRQGAHFGVLTPPA